MTPRITAATPGFDSAGAPMSSVYGDIYHSVDSGPGQARHVFLRGNDLPSRWSARRLFTVVETGFGLGLNFLATWAAWRDDPRACERLHFVSIERHPFSRADLATLHRRYPEFETLSRQLLAAWPLLIGGTHRLHFEGGRLTLTLVFADVADAVRGLRASANAFYLDGFAPDKNPAMWTPPLMKAIARLAAADATVATYTTARGVRDALAAAGFAVDKRPGFGRKRDMLAGRYAPRWATRYLRTVPSPHEGERHAMIVGAGVAGSAVAERLSARGWRLDLIDSVASRDAPAANLHAGISQPHISRDDCLLSRFTRAGFVYQLAQEMAYAEDTSVSQRCGALQLAGGTHAETAMADMVESQGLDPDYARYVDRDDACAAAGRSVAAGGWWFPTAGWLRAGALVRARLRAAARDAAGAVGASVPSTLTIHTATIARLARIERHWRAFDASGAVVATAPVVVLANGCEAIELADLGDDQMQRVRGQLSYLPTPAYPAPRVVVSGEGYILPAIDGIAVAGATYDVGESAGAPTLTGHLANLARVERLLPGSTHGVDTSSLGGAVGLRCIAPDRMPLIGAVVDVAAARLVFGASGRPHPGAHSGIPLRQLPRVAGMYACLAFASRGLSWTALAAEVVASQLEGEPLPLAAALLDAIDPGRFVLRRLRHGKL